MTRQAPDFEQLLLLLRQGVAEGKETAVSLTSNSMSPLFWAGDQMLLAAATPEQLAPGDIIALAEASGLVAHRYWGMDENGELLTRGDRALVTDPPWQREALVGRVVGRQRGGRVLLFGRGRGRWLARGVRNLTAVNHTLLTRHRRPFWLRLTHRLLFGIRWVLTAVIQ